MTQLARFPTLPAVLMLLAMTSPPGRAAEFCVGDGTQLAAALAVSETNGEDDLVKLKAGTFAHPAEFTVTLPAGEELLLVGGWIDAGTPCSDLDPNPELTVIDGQLQRGVLRVVTTAGAGNLLVTNLTLERGKLNIAGSSGLRVFGDAGYTGRIHLERLILQDNQSGFAPAAYLQTGGDLLLRNLLVVRNRGSSSLFLQQLGNGRSDVVNSTIADNVSSDAGSSVLGLSRYDSAPLGTITNSIVQGNMTAIGQRDFDQPYNFYFANSIVQKSLYALNGEFVLHAPARFLDPSAGDYRLHPRSPGINRGSAFPPGGLGLLDNAALDRMIGSAPDLGAYETEVLFSDGLE